MSAAPAAAAASSAQSSEASKAVADVKCFATFEEMGLPPLLLRGVRDYGFQQPTAIQQRAVVPLINRCPVIVQAQPGADKTGAIVMGLLARIDFRKKALQALVLSPMRELAVQTHEMLSGIGQHLAEGNPQFCQTFVGGNRVQDDTHQRVDHAFTTSLFQTA